MILQHIVSSRSNQDATLSVLNNGNLIWCLLKHAHSFDPVIPVEGREAGSSSIGGGGPSTPMAIKFRFETSFPSIKPAEGDKRAKRIEQASKSGRRVEMDRIKGRERDRPVTVETDCLSMLDTDTDTDTNTQTERDTQYKQVPEINPHSVPPSSFVTP